MIKRTDVINGSSFILSTVRGLTCTECAHTRNVCGIGVKGGQLVHFLTDRNVPHVETETVA